MSGITKKELRKKLVLNKEVEAYLRKRKVLTPFKRNCIDKWHKEITIASSMAKSKGKCVLDCFHRMVAEPNKETLVIRAFIWGETPEGHGFWHDVCFDY